MKLSLKAKYAICGMFDLAYNGDGRPLQVRVVGERQKIPPRYLEQIFQHLRRAALVEGKRGPGGGYVLARAAGAISLRDIIEAVEGPLSDSLADGPPPADPHELARPSFVWPEIATRVEASLAGLTLESLCSRAAAGAVPRAHEDSRMWHI